MNPTEATESAQKAGELFDEILAPLAKARRAATAQTYFASAPDANAESYFEPPNLARMGLVDFEFPGGGTADGLIDALAAVWVAQGDTALAAMAPRLKEIAHALSTEAVEGDGTVDILCYTMF
jgi:hypothetical protein